MTRHYNGVDEASTHSMSFQQLLSINALHHSRMHFLHINNLHHTEYVTLGKRAVDAEIREYAWSLYNIDKQAVTMSTQVAFINVRSSLYSMEFIR